jgi:hypothetical protein
VEFLEVVLEIEIWSDQMKMCKSTAWKKREWGTRNRPRKNGL